MSQGEALVMAIHYKKNWAEMPHGHIKPFHPIQDIWQNTLSRVFGK